MARDLGAPGPAPAPPAVRAAAPGWRDPRLWIGIVIVAVSVVAGARLLSAADDTVAVWSASADMGPGDRVGPTDLVATRVRFADPDDLAGYFTAADELPADLELSRGVGAGELLPRAAVGPAGESDTVELPIAVDAEQVPSSVRAGSEVDVWLVPSGAGTAARAVGRAARAAQTDAPALAGVTVVDAPPLEEAFSASGKRQLVLAVGDDDARRFFALLAAAEDPVLTVVRRG